MTVAIDPAWALAVFLTFVRVGAVFMLSPVFSSIGGLAVIRVLLTLALSALLVSGMGLRVPPAMLQPGALVLGAMLEVVIGATLSFGVFAAFGAFSVAGKLLDIQSGLGLGNVYDPVIRGGAPLFATMLQMLGVVVFFGVDGHHALLRGLAFSLQQVPPGSGLSSLDVDAVVRQFGLMFSLGVSLIVPVLLCLLLTEVGLAVVSRVLPQMNIFTVGVPVKIIAAIGLLAMTLGYLGPAMGRVYASIFQYWEQVLV